MNRHLPLAITLGAIFSVWFVQLFVFLEVVIRFGGRDTRIGVVNGDLQVNWVSVPETHFDFWFERSHYSGSDWPLVERFFAIIPYPTLEFDSWSGGGGVPLWNLAVLSIAVWAMVRGFRYAKGDGTVLPTGARSIGGSKRE